MLSLPHMKMSSACAMIMVARLPNNWRRVSNLVVCYSMLVRKIDKLFLLLLLVFWLNACSQGYHLANRFVVDETDIHVLILPPAQLIKTFLPEHPDSITGDDIPVYDESDIRFVNRTNDSLYISEFLNGLRQRLDLLYIQTYGVEEIDSFFQVERSEYIFVVAQMELLEYLHRETFMARDRDANYMHREPIRVLEHNTWFEFMKLDDADFGMEVLFSVQATSDHVEGRFIRRASGEVVFDAERFFLTDEDLKELAFFAGQQNGQNIFDYLMNLYVRERSARDPDRYFHYDMERHSIRDADTPGFIRIRREMLNTDY